MNKNKFIVIILLLVFLSTIFFIFLKSDFFVYFSIKRKYSKDTELNGIVDKIYYFSEQVKNDKNNIENYSSLGLMWKSLADKTNNKRYYQQSLKIYKKAIELTKHKNAMLLDNAGTISVILCDYKAAEKFFLESIDVEPGNYLHYKKLIELYKYKMNKNKNEILEIYDLALDKILINRDEVKKDKEKFIKENN